MPSEEANDILLASLKGAENTSGRAKVIEGATRHNSSKDGYSFASIKVNKFGSSIGLPVGHPFLRDGVNFESVREGKIAKKASPNSCPCGSNDAFDSSTGGHSTHDIDNAQYARDRMRLDDRAIVAKFEGRFPPRVRNRRVTFCITDCKYAVVRRVAKRRGWGLIGEAEQGRSCSNEDLELCNVHWIDSANILERMHSIQPWQYINHFPGMANIARKARLAQNLEKMRRKHPRYYAFYPRTWGLPGDFSEFRQQFNSRGKSSHVFIVKPDAGCQGRGIFLTQELDKVSTQCSLVAQIYIPNPLLIDGFKFDLRLYVLVTSCSPLRIYIYHNGLVRFCTEKFEPPSSDNLDDQCRHLTNYAINKHNDNFIANEFVEDQDVGSKRSLAWFMEWVALQYSDSKASLLWQRISSLCTKTILPILPTLQREYAMIFERGRKLESLSDEEAAQGSHCFELLGIDVMIDTQLKPWLIECNTLPSFGTDSPLDREVKKAVLEQTLRVIRAKPMDQWHFEEHERRQSHLRLFELPNKPPIIPRTHSLHESPCFGGNAASTSTVRASAQSKPNDSRVGTYGGSYTARYKAGVLEKYREELQASETNNWDRCDYEEEYEDRHLYKDDKEEDKSSDDESSDEEIAYRGGVNEVYNEMTEGGIDIDSENKGFLKHMDAEEEEEVKMETTCSPLQLIDVSSGKVLFTFSVLESSVTLGRLQIQGASDEQNAHISRSHCKFDFDCSMPDSLGLRDLGTVNGTYVNGKRIEHVRIHAGNIVHLGGSRNVKIGSTIEESKFPTWSFQVRIAQTPGGITSTSMKSTDGNLDSNGLPRAGKRAVGTHTEMLRRIKAMYAPRWRSGLSEEQHRQILGEETAALESFDRIFPVPKNFEGKPSWVDDYDLLLEHAFSIEERRIQRLKLPLPRSSLSDKSSLGSNKGMNSTLSHSTAEAEGYLRMDRGLAQQQQERELQTKKLPPLRRKNSSLLAAAM